MLPPLWDRGLVREPAKHVSPDVGYQEQLRESDDLAVVVIPVRRLVPKTEFKLTVPGQTKIYDKTGVIQPVLRWILYDGPDGGEVAPGLGAAEKQDDSAPAQVRRGNTLQPVEHPGRLPNLGETLHVIARLNLDMNDVVEANLGEPRVLGRSLFLAREGIEVNDCPNCNCDYYQRYGEFPVHVFRLLPAPPPHEDCKNQHDYGRNEPARPLDEVSLSLVDHQLPEGNEFRPD